MSFSWFVVKSVEYYQLSAFKFLIHSFFLPLVQLITPSVDLHRQFQHNLFFFTDLLLATCRVTQSERQWLHLMHFDTFCPQLFLHLNTTQNIIYG